MATRQLQHWCHCTFAVLAQGNKRSNRQPAQRQRRVSDSGGAGAAAAQRRHAALPVCVLRCRRGTILLKSGSQKEDEPEEGEGGGAFRLQFVTDSVQLFVLILR